jgi:hypothetical protein
VDLRTTLLQRSSAESESRPEVSFDTLIDAQIVSSPRFPKGSMQVRRSTFGLAVSSSTCSCAGDCRSMMNISRCCSRRSTVSNASLYVDALFQHSFLLHSLLSFPCSLRKGILRGFVPGAPVLTFVRSQPPFFQPQAVDTQCHPTSRPKLEVSSPVCWSSIP